MDATLPANETGQLVQPCHPGARDEYRLYSLNFAPMGRFRAGRPYLISSASDADLFNPGFPDAH
jgi:hypothetical protein